MTQVDFYVLPGDAPEARLNTACKVTEKALSQGLRVYIRGEDAAQSARLDEVLWTFRASSFVPHAVAPLDPEDPSPVLIGHGDEDPGFDADVLINLAPEVPLFFGRFARVAEVVDQAPERLSQGRARFRFYQDRGYKPESHRLKS